MPSIGRIQIEQQYASIGIKVTPSQLSITTPRPKLEFQQEMPEMSIDSQKANLKVNWRQEPIDSAEFLQATLNGDALAAVDARNKAKQAKAAAEAEQDGIQGAAHKPKFEAAEAPNFTPSTVGDFSMVKKDTSKPEMTVPEVELDPGQISIKWSTQQFKVEWDGDYMPEFTVEPPYSVEIFLRNRPSIRISVEEVNDPYNPGVIVDRKL